MRPLRPLAILLMLSAFWCRPIEAAEFAVVQCVLPTTNGGTVDCISSGFGTPKGAIVFGGFGTANGTVVDGSAISIGFYDGTNQRAVGGTAVDNLGTTDTGAFTDTNSVYGTLSPGAHAKDGDCTASTITDGIRLTCADAPPSAYRVNVVLIGGTGISNVAVGTDDGNATQNSAVTVTTGFQTDLLFMISQNNNDNTYNLSIGMGWRNGGTIVQRAIGYINNDASSSVSISSILTTNRIMSPGISSTQLELTAIDATSFDLTTRTSGGSRNFHYLAIKLNGLAAQLSTSAAPTSTGSNAVTGVGFTPQIGFMLAGEHAAVDTLYSASNGTNLGFSAFTTAASGTSSVWGDDGAPTSNEESVTDAKVCRTRKASADFDTCTLTSFDADGATFNYSVASSSTRQRALLFVEGAAAGTNQMRRRLLP